MKNNISEKYSKYFENTKKDVLHPTEWIIKALIGRHNALPNQIQEKGQALDIGFGDGRNIILLSEIGYDAYGIEIDERICVSVGDLMKARNVNCCLSEGYNHKLNFKSDFFDLIIASNSIYYTNKNIDVNLCEVKRVLKSGKPFVFNIIGKENYLLKGADIIDNDYAVIKQDPLGLRNGQKIFYCENEKTLRSLLSSYFTEFYVGEYNVRHWNYLEHFYTIFAINDKK